MKFVANITLHAAESVDYTPDQVENLLDALHDIDTLDEVDASGSLASRDLHLELVVEAKDIDAAQSTAADAVRRALAAIGGEVVGERSSSPEDYRKTSIATRELMPA